MLDGHIIDQKDLNVESIITLEILTMVKQEQTYLPFPYVITSLCKQVGVSFKKKIDVEVTSSTSTDIRWMEVEFLRG